MQTKYEEAHRTHKNSTMMPIAKSTMTRIGYVVDISSLSFSRQRFGQRHRCSSSLGMMYSLDKSKRSFVRRFLSTGGSKSTKSKSEAAKEFVNAEMKESSMSPSSSISQFWRAYLQPKPMPDRWSAAWYQEMALICTVFAITGSSTMVLVRPAVSKGLGLQGSFRDGPWSFRICSLVVMTPIYATLLLVVGTVFGRHAYFRHFSVKMWSRFGIPPEMIDKSWHVTKKNFRKW